MTFDNKNEGKRGIKKMSKEKKNIPKQNNRHTHTHTQRHRRRRHRDTRRRTTTTC